MLFLFECALRVEKGNGNENMSCSSCAVLFWPPQNERFFVITFIDAFGRHNVYFFLKKNS
jgi:hypothetical protein